MYTKNGNKVGIPMETPVKMVWSPSGAYCIAMYPKTTTIFTTRPAFKIIADVNETLSSCLWHHDYLFYANSLGDIKARKYFTCVMS